MVLIAHYKVQEHNKVVFTKAKHLAGKEYYISGNTIKQCNKTTNGTITCYEVPMDKLENLEYRKD